MTQSGIDEAFLGAQQPTGLAPGRRAADRGEAPALPDPVVPRGSSWRTAQSLILVIADTFVLTTAVVIAFVGRFGPATSGTYGVAYGAAGALIVGLWLLLLASDGCYQTRFLGTGTDEFKRISSATVKAFAGVTIVAFMFRIDIARGFVAIAMPVGFVLLLIGRLALRKEIQHARRSGRALHRIVVVGDRERVADLTAQLRLDPNAGFAVVGACLPDLGESMREIDQIPTVGTFDTVGHAVAITGADTVAITAGPRMSAQQVREIAWSLEGRTVDLVVAPTITDVAGPRITMRPVSGLPLIYVDEPEFTGVRRVLKRALDLVCAGVGLLLLAPLLLVVAAAIRLTSNGPALFTQQRIGKSGKRFAVYKFRTMRIGAEAEQAAVWAEADDGTNNKAKNDPRITTIGRHLRRWSIDELPQLINVVGGSMSLVGPRPMQQVEVDELPDPGLRRHLSQPGITGLWQVSGRSDTTWEERMRLDMYYVENWSLGLDIGILLRTLLAVTRGSGAY